MKLVEQEHQEMLLQIYNKCLHEIFFPAEKIKSRLGKLDDAGKVKYRKRLMFNKPVMDLNMDSRKESR